MKIVFLKQVVKALQGRGKRRWRLVVKRLKRVMVLSDFVTAREREPGEGERGSPAAGKGIVSLWLKFMDRHGDVQLTLAPRDDGERGKRGSATGNKAHLVAKWLERGLERRTYFSYQ